MAAAIVGSFDAPDAAQRASREQILDAISGRPDVARRTAMPGHLTASSVIVDPATGLALLCFHPKVGRWIQTGGHADGDTNLRAVAWREGNEETGLAALALWSTPVDLDVHPAGGANDAARVDPPLHLDTRFMARCAPGTSRVDAVSPEGLGLRWCGEPELEELDVDPVTRRLVRAARALSATLD
ncbi:MAG: hydrolase [Actinomycetia bacterium]|nr:hydrolase [Actinomycetes bacterium]